MAAAHPTPGQPKRRRSPAVTVAEFALVAPIVFMLIFGMMEGARIFSAWIIVSNEAREGARVGAVATGMFNDPGALACQRVMDRAGGLLDATRLTCSTTTTQDPMGNAAGLTLTLRYSLPLVIPIATPLFGRNSVPMQARSTMRVE